MKKTFLLVLSLIILSPSFAQQKIKSDPVVTITSLQRTIDSLKVEQIKQKQNFDKLEANALKTIEDTKITSSIFIWLIASSIALVTYLVAVVIWVNLTDRKKLREVENEIMNRIHVNLEDEKRNHKNEIDVFHKNYKVRFTEEIQKIADAVSSIFNEKVNNVLEEKTKELDSFLIRLKSDAITGFGKTFEAKIEEYKEKTIKDISAALSNLFK